MSYTKTRKKVAELTTCEISTMKAEGLAFRSKYEAESVIRIQAGEVAKELKRCQSWVDSITDAVALQRDVGIDDYAHELMIQAEYLATEAVRLAAVAGALEEMSKKKGAKA